GRVPAVTNVAASRQAASTPTPVSPAAGSGPAGRFPQLPHVAVPVAGQELQPLPPRHQLARRPSEAGPIKVGGAAGGADQPCVGLPQLDQQFVDALVLVEVAAYLVHEVGIG